MTKRPGHSHVRMGVLSDLACADPESFEKGGPNSTLKTFFMMRGKKDPNTTESEPSSSRQRNAIQMTFCWPADNGLVAL